ncbi:hypothetical protein F183_A28240 [Bryobacterales bacterium F-183]|nr:hypothetical protein F183_A28240 [Bryobacterales bacterium F-183]
MLLGALFLVMGLDYFLHMMPELPISDRGGAFLTALLDTGYLFPMIKVIEIIAGAMILSGRMVAAALALLAPITMNIVLYHAFLDSNSAWIGFGAGALHLLLLLRYRGAFLPLFQLVPNEDDSAIAVRPSEAIPTHVH